MHEATSRDTLAKKMVLPNAPSAPIAVICAMDCELTHLRTALSPHYEDWYAGRRSWLTTLQEYPIILTCCGIGMSSAAATTEALIAHYHPIAILNYGCTGAHRPYILPGDLIIGSRAVAPDCITLEADGREKYEGMCYLHAGTPQNVDYLPAAPSLLALATRTATRLAGQHEPWPLDSGWPPSIPHRSPQHFIGTISSSDRWNRDPERIHRIVAQHDSMCEDMEAAAIALTCASHDVPFLSIKDISNNELLRTTDEQFSIESEGQLGKRASVIIHAILDDYIKAQETRG